MSGTTAAGTMGGARGGEAMSREEVCASACAGIPTAELEAGILVELVAACFRFKDDPRIREVLERLAAPSPHPLRLVEDGAARRGRRRARVEEGATADREP